jgi:hypothetical protein
MISKLKCRVERMHVTSTIPPNNGPGKARWLLVTHTMQAMTPQKGNVQAEAKNRATAIGWHRWWRESDFHPIKE